MLYGFLHEFSRNSHVALLIPDDFPLFLIAEMTHVVVARLYRAWATIHVGATSAIKSRDYDMA
jgi:hypothetical protein